MSNLEQELRLRSCLDEQLASTKEHEDTWLSAPARAVINTLIDALAARLCRYDEEERDVYAAAIIRNEAFRTTEERMIRTITEATR